MFKDLYYKIFNIVIIQLDVGHLWYNENEMHFSVQMYIVFVNVDPK